MYETGELVVLNDYEAAKIEVKTERGYEVVRETISTGFGEKVEEKITWRAFVKESEIIGRLPF